MNQSLYDDIRRERREKRIRERAEGERIAAATDADIQDNFAWGIVSPDMLHLLLEHARGTSYVVVSNERTGHKIASGTWGQEYTGRHGECDVRVVTKWVELWRDGDSYTLVYQVRDMSDQVSGVEACDADPDRVAAKSVPLRTSTIRRVGITRAEAVSALCTPAGRRMWLEAKREAGR